VTTLIKAALTPANSRMALSLIPCTVIAQPSLPAARKFRIATSMLLRQRAGANDGKWYKVAKYGLLFPYAVFL
jgi:hypothetical protein